MRRSESVAHTGGVSMKAGKWIMLLFGNKSEVVFKEDMVSYPGMYSASLFKLKLWWLCLHVSIDVYRPPCCPLQTGHTCLTKVHARRMG
jgi:hypothetical protein